MAMGTIAAIVLGVSCTSPHPGRLSDTQDEAQMESDVGQECLDEPGVFDEEQLWIVEWPIVWTTHREALTAAYLAHHRGEEKLTGDPAVDSRMVPKMIVLHWTAGPTATSAWHNFQAEEDRRRGLRDYQRVNLSAHFIVDQQGTIFRLMDETRVGRHTIGLNHLAIGIENVGDDRLHPLTDQQLEANVALIRWLSSRYPTITHLIGHYEYRLFEGHPQFEELDPKFRTGRRDPGEDFMRRVREEVWDLSLKGAPDQPEQPDQGTTTLGLSVP